MIKQFIFFLVLVLLCAAIFSCKEQKGLHYQTFQTNRGWGYNVLVNQQILIHQDILPVQGTVQGFASEQQASAAAEIVVERLKNRERPSLTGADLLRIQKQ
jgi:hypothetical protein